MLRQQHFPIPRREAFKAWIRMHGGELELEANMARYDALVKEAERIDTEAKMAQLCTCAECAEIEPVRRAPAVHQKGCRCYHCWTGEDEAERQAWVDGIDEQMKSDIAWCAVFVSLLPWGGVDGTEGERQLRYAMKQKKLILVIRPKERVAIRRRSV